MRFLDEPLHRLHAYEEIEDWIAKKQGPVQVSGAVESEKVHIMEQAGHESARLIVTYDERQARLLLDDLKFFRRDALLFPAKDLLFYQADMRSNQIGRERMQVFRKLSEGGTAAIVTSIEGLMNRVSSPAAFSGMLLSLSEGSIAELPALTERLVSLGYQRVARVEVPGEFSVQGGILDVFDITEELPYRVEFFDDEIDTIRIFQPDSQVSVERVEEIRIYPAVELFLSGRDLSAGMKKLEKDYKKNLEALKEVSDYEACASLQQMFRDLQEEVSRRDLSGAVERFMPYFHSELTTLLDYLPEDTVISVEEPARMMEYGLALETEYLESFRMRLQKGLALPKQSEILVSVKDTFRRLETGRTLAFTGLDTRVTELRIRQNVHIMCQSQISYRGNFPGLVADLKRLKQQKYSTVLLTAGRTRASRMAEELREYEISAYFSEDPEETVKPGTLLVAHGNLHKGFVYPDLKFVVLTEGDIFGAEKKKKKVKHQEYDGTRIRSFSELSFGDYVVHESYGIGIYQGIEKITTDGISRDYMKISYGASGTLYVPVTNLDSVQKYASSDAKPPKISRLDSPEWKKTKSRVKTAVQEVAKELVELYAERQSGKGYLFSKDTVWQKEFEELFPFEETEDQLSAIQSIKEDMEAGKIMDRLVCGDVGFGKTEVAIRAAFKCVQDSCQVAYLVPTTILAQQHYNTFRQRMGDYPVKVEMLSRFSTAEQVRKTIAGLENGSVDIVIGTHRLLSKDVKFKKLGLLIIDEEQRFGVNHKEKIKLLKKSVDVLTLTATPIPRTLHMGLIGVRDMSVLEEPPTDRLAIQTYVMEYQEELVREAIHRELSRGGQVYYVHNRVSDISEVAHRVQELVPEANVAFAHGKMSEHELSRVMLSFIEGEIDVLVSTTIIETGLDIPNVNTIIVQDAERYGLSQLYQLRGRVGRSTRQAYAFIMYRKNRIPSEDAEKRLEAIRQFTELGSGIRIAMQDLEIRGAGALLGNAQSGHMMEVGYDLYCKMLSEAVRAEKGGEAPAEQVETLLDVKVDAYIPATYVANESVKLELYKKIAFLSNDEEKENLYEELMDRFGQVPKVVENLMEAAVLRAMARRLYMTEIKGNASELTFRFSKTAAIRSEGIPELIQEYAGAVRFSAGENPALVFRELNTLNIDQTKILEKIRSLLLDMQEKLTLRG